ncbi:MAG: mobile mystery protein B [Phycisphaerales bacterium]|tara:strand:- start:308 stop:907 length:600 start_codon:yes stop_codon:yes gene_type:complete
MSFDSPIEGQTPLDDISGLLDRSIQTSSQLNMAEAENIRKVILKYLASKPTKRMAKFDLAWIRKLHEEMFGDVWAWAGAWRTSQVNIPTASDPVLIEVDLQNMLDNLHSWSSFDWPLIEQAAHLHHRAVCVHPYPNGNGRWSRMLANIWLKLHGEGVVIWPEQIIGSESTIRTEYLGALRLADGGDFQAFIELHSRYQE